MMFSFESTFPQGTSGEEILTLSTKCNNTLAFFFYPKFVVFAMAMSMSPLSHEWHAD